jgi:two-component system sensor histidine kinase MprB
MTLRRRLVLAFAGLVTVAVLLVGGITYSATVNTLNDELDRSLASAAATVAAGGTVTTAEGVTVDGHGHDEDHDGAGAIVSTAQRVAADGTTTHVSGTEVSLPVDRITEQLAARGDAGTGHFSDATVDGVDYRVYTLALGDGQGAVQVGRDLSSSTRVLVRIAVLTALIGLAVIAASAFAGWWIARQITKRLAALTEAAETVSSSGELTVPIEVTGRDEVGRLADSMRTMLAELAESRDAQRRLVQNAGHELRTPITSLRTNTRVLRRLEELPEADRARLLDDVDGELKELTALVNELIELATDTHNAEEPVPTSIGQIVAKVADRVQRRSGIPIRVDADDTVMPVRPHALERAVTNLVDNSAKFDPSGQPIQVTVHGGVIQVADRGPGVPDAELRQIFERFHRTDAARSLPGSGLGLAIVAEIAAQHGGSVEASSREGGGLVVTLRVGPEDRSTLDVDSDRGSEPTS